MNTWTRNNVQHNNPTPTRIARLSRTVDFDASHGEATESAPPIIPCDGAATHSLGAQHEAYAPRSAERAGSGLVSDASRWDDARMSENIERRSATSAPGGPEDAGQTPPKESPAKPSTGQMRTVGQRRRDSETKLDAHQRETQAKRSE